MRSNSGEEWGEVKRSHRNIPLETNGEGGLDQVLVKHKSRLERERWLLLLSSQRTRLPGLKLKRRKEASNESNMIVKSQQRTEQPWEGGNGQKSRMAREKNMEKNKPAKGSQLDSNKKAMTIQDLFFLFPIWVF
ncbi:hypothetical protein SESBI_31895 [Sesbania bispinosa]|nr:hypothetical protein SESBI_31895 [Sesbania bispinosa]